MKKRSQPRLGKLAPRFTLIVNPYMDCRYSTCPICKKATYARKFALFIHVGPAAERSGIVLGKTGKYCSKCELIIMHEFEIREQIAASGRFATSKNKDAQFLVLGTVKMKVWKQSLEDPKSIGGIFEHMADIKSYYEVEYEPGGWHIDN